MKQFVVSLMMGLALVLAPSAFAQTPDPRTLPLVTPGNFTFKGTFQLPAGWQWGQHAISVTGDQMTIACNVDTGVGVVKIPPIGGTATVVTPCTNVNIGRINPAYNVAIGGVFATAQGVTVSGYSTYNNGPDETVTHITAPTIAGLATATPYRVGTARPAMVAGPMGHVPPEWQALLGGPALTGQCCISIISRSSYGISMVAFNPFLRTSSKWWIGYPDGHETLGLWDKNPPGPYYGMSDLFAGQFIIPGTRTLVKVARHGESACYGTGCNDPANPGAQSTHGYKYRWQLVFIDLNAILTATNPWDVIPYGALVLPGVDDTKLNGTRGAFFDPTTSKLYVTEMDSLKVSVYEYATPAQPPTNCIPGTESLVSDDSATAQCVNNVKTITETWTRVGDVPETNGGLACTPVVTPRTRTESCVSPPQPPVGLFDSTATTCKLDMTLLVTSGTVQFKRRLVGATTWTNHGTADASAPYTRSASQPVGTYEGQAVWSGWPTPIDLGTQVCRIP